MTATSHVRLRVLGAATRARLLAAVEALVAAWSADWVVGAPLGVRFAEEPTNGSCASRCFARDDGEGVVLAEWRCDEPLAVLMGGDVVASRDPRYTGVADEALRDLAGRLLGGPLRTSSETDTPAPRGAVRFEIRRGLDAVSDLVLDARLRDRLAPPITAARGALSARGEAALHVSAEATASLPMGAFALDRVAALVPGDVLVTDRRLDDGLDLHVAGMPVGVRVAVGRRGERRAILALSSEQS